MTVSQLMTDVIVPALKSRHLGLEQAKDDIGDNWYFGIMKSAGDERHKLIYGMTSSIMTSMALMRLAEDDPSVNDIIRNGGQTKNDLLARYLGTPPAYDELTPDEIKKATLNILNQGQDELYVYPNIDTSSVISFLAKAQRVGMGKEAEVLIGLADEEDAAIKIHGGSPQ